MKRQWQTKKLGDICDLLNRGISPRYLEKGGVCVLNQKCVRDHQINYEYSRRHDLSAKKVDKKRFIQLGDVLVNSTGTGTLGRVAQVRENPGEPTTVDSHITIVRPKTAMFHLDFFGYMLVMIEDIIKEAGEGCGGQTELARSVLAEKFSVSFPESLSEQQRIVGILDEALEGIATARANAEKNLQNARAVFESRLNAVFAQCGEGWVEKRLDEACEILMGQSPDGDTYNMIGEGVPLINGPVEFSPGSFGKTTRSKFTTRPTKVCKENDLILCVRGSTTGKMNIASCNSCIGRGVAAIRSREHQPWINYFINAKRKEIFRLGTGATFPNVSGAMLGGLKLSMPSLSKQKELGAKFDSLRAETQHLESIYQSKLTALEELKKSLLNQAFSGNL
jgi:type I restriction enzyme, S subunit